ncbi:MAG: sulfotransferase [Steroidobacteraceae bacterium]
MSDQSLDRKAAWIPPPRPDWVRRFNQEGEYMDIAGVVPLDVDSLMQSATRSTGLSDFGTDPWFEPFKVLVKSLNEEASFNLLGRIRARAELIIMLEARLQIEDWYKRHPEIDDEVITKPIFIIGQGRSGTTMLINVLSSNPDNGVVMTWEGMFPCPPPEKATYTSDPRIEKAHHLITQVNRVTPTMVSMHNFAGNVPHECLQLFGPSFMSAAWFNSMGQVPTYTDFISKLDHESAYRYHKKILKLLQWRNPRSQWVVKSPSHLDQLPTLLKVYPDACLIWPHRDPVKALASLVSLVGTVQWGRTDQPFKFGSWDDYVDAKGVAARFNRVIDWLESGVVPKKQLFNMLYRDLVTDTMRVLEEMYAYFGLTLTERGRAAMADYMARNPRTARPAHKFDVGPSTVIKEDRQALARYQQYFGVPNEI